MNVNGGCAAQRPLLVDVLSVYVKGLGDEGDRPESEASYVESVEEV